MSFNGSGVFVVNSTGQPVVATTLIEASVFNAFTADVATGLSTCITKDGQTTVTANIPFAGFYATNVGVRSINGSVAAPGLAFQNDTGTGFYRIGAQNIGFSLNGTKTLDLDATRLLVVQHLRFTDATYDIGTSASVSVTGRPRDLWLSRNLSCPGVASLSSMSAIDVSASSYGGGYIGVAGVSCSALVAATVGGAMVATQAQQETGSATTVVVTPGRQHFHVSAAKGWVTTAGGASPSISESYNVTSLTDIGQGQLGINWATDFSNTTHCDVALAWASAASPQDPQVNSAAKAAGVTNIDCYGSINTLEDPNGFFCVAFGDQA